MRQTEISIENARSHNLKGVSCRIPLRAITVISGVSGCGKTTLAFDTLYAEGQRRYVSSLSTYARQFLERLPRPQVDRISNLPPAIAIEQRNSVTNARSTVGTSTEVLDQLRLLFARTGQTVCPDCDAPVQAGTVSGIAERVVERWGGERLSIGSPLPPPETEPSEELRVRLAREGFTRLLGEDARVVDLTEIDARALDALRPVALLLIDRLVVPRDDGEGRARLSEAVASGLARGRGELIVVDSGGGRASFREGFLCNGCGRRFASPEPHLFSFNSPIGACPTCQGFGRITGIDFDLVVPDPGKSLREDAIAPFTTPMGRAMHEDLMEACRKRRVPVSRPFCDLSEKQQSWVLEGDDEWYGVRGFFEWLEGRRYKVQARVLIARYRRYDPCPDCAGARLCEEALCVRVAGRNLGELSRWTLAELRAWVDGLELDAPQLARAGRLLEMLRLRLATTEAVGLGYLGLDRQARTLSGGEAQRIQLATALGGSLTASLYVLDEPSIGLHPRDIQQLLEILRAIRDQGNTVVVVEHAAEVVSAADHVIDLGPRAGSLGGEVVVEGTVDEVRGCQASLTGRALRGEFSAPERKRRRSRSAIRIVGASANNLQGLSAEIPLGQLVAVTGVSGAGKSSLIRGVLVKNCAGRPEAPGSEGCKRIEGTKAISQVVVVDQSPASRSPRSNPATVTKAFEGIRKRFAATRQAKALELAPGWFSFNVPGGRCDDCEGAGEVVIDMQFLEDLRVPCDSCAGLRYRKEALEIQLEGRTIVDVLAMSIDEAIQAFAHDTQIAKRLLPLQRVGLGYLGLGQPLSTLSGGEHQRVRLAQALAEGAPGALYILDEPTTGLHPADIEVLLRCLAELIDAGGSVVVIEHNLDVIRHADCVLDIGPGGGPEGGRLVASGSPEQVARVAGSFTGAALRGDYRA